MTTNDETPREALARCMTSGFSRKVWDGNFKPSFDLRYNRAVRDRLRNDFLADADAVIAHLWERADSGEATDAVDSICRIHGMSRTNAEAVVDALLTTLLGPNPNEQEDNCG